MDPYFLHTSHKSDLQLALGNSNFGINLFFGPMILVAQ